MHELKYKAVLTRDEMCLVHELLHDELMRYLKESEVQKAKLNPSDILDAHEIEKIEERLMMIRKLKRMFGSVR